MADAAAQSRSGLARRLSVGSWAVWLLPPGGLAFVLAVDAAAVAALGWGIHTQGFGGARAAITFAALIAAGLVCVEVIRRIGEPSGFYQDLMTVWTLPIALLLPTPYALLAPIADHVSTQRRVRRAATYRRAFSMAAIGLAHAGAGRLFHALAGAHVFDAAWSQHAALLLGAAALAGVCCSAANTGLVTTAIWLSSADARWHELLVDRDVLTLSGVEVATGVVVTVLAAQSPLLIVIALPPMILLQRSLWHSQLTAAARVDAKTGLLNAATWQLEAEREIARAARAHRPLAVLLLDLDHFKAVNDRYGHLAGDRVLVEVADVLRAELRSFDVVGRFGGEEFVVAIAGEADRARDIAQRLRRRIAEHPVDVNGRSIHVTVSVGIATLGIDGEDPTELLAAADSALYAAKAAGRDQVVVADDMPIAADGNGPGKGPADDAES